MKKSKLLIFLILFIVICLSAFIFIRLRNSTKITPVNRDAILYSVPQYRQDDLNWANDTLGSSSFTMKTSGCLTTCIASALNQNITPGELNKMFSENNVYDSDGNLMWAQLEKMGYTVSVLSTVSEDMIYDCLKNGHFPIARVRVNGVGNFHYLLIVGIENGEYICMDPLKDQLTLLSDYLNRIYAIRVVY